MAIVKAPAGEYEVPKVVYQTYLDLPQAGQAPLMVPIYPPLRQALPASRQVRNLFAVQAKEVHR